MLSSFAVPSSAYVVDIFYSLFARWGVDLESLRKHASLLGKLGLYTGDEYMMFSAKGREYIDLLDVRVSIVLFHLIITTTKSNVQRHLYPKVSFS